MKDNMKIVCVCGSVKFKDEMLKYREQEHAKGNWVLLPENMEIDIQKIDARVKQQMERLHLYKIVCSDLIVVWNRGGYIGESTRHEIEYTRMCDKPIQYLEPVEEAGF
jgi:hypothetical protein